MEDCGGSGRRSFTCFPVPTSFVVHLNARENVGDFGNGQGQKSFSTLAKVGSQVAYSAIVDPDPVRFVSGRVAYFSGRQTANVAKASIGLSMPVSGFMKSDTLHIGTTLPNAVV